MRGLRGYGLLRAAGWLPRRRTPRNESYSPQAVFANVISADNMTELMDNLQLKIVIDVRGKYV